MPVQSLDVHEYQPSAFIRAQAPGKPGGFLSDDLALLWVWPEIFQAKLGNEGMGCAVALRKESDWEDKEIPG